MTVPSRVDGTEARRSRSSIAVVHRLQRRFGEREVVRTLDLRLDDRDRVALWALARKGVLGLGDAYVVGLVRLAPHAAPAYAAWHKARKRGGDSGA